MEQLWTHLTKTVLNLNECALKDGIPLLCAFVTFETTNAIYSKIIEIQI